MFQNTHVKIEQWDNYRKMSFRNRYVVAGSNGLVHLSVPLEKGRDRQQLMRDTRVSYSGRWQQEQIRTLESCYARAPYFEYYWPELRRLLEGRETFLLDKNMAALNWLGSVLRLPASISLTDQYLEAYPEEVSDRRDKVLPKNYLQYDPGIRYTQVFEERIGFRPNLCVIDYLLCAGPDLKSSLKGSVLTF
ncbi:MAG: WbqC family protein [Chitinophagaceae bacterium]|nr:WbqC family protein [Chitinophagaceae bacterium]